ncbi:MAG: hypothetical protein ACTTJV_08995 [Ottowia sp.]
MNHFSKKISPFHCLSCILISNTQDPDYPSIIASSHYSILKSFSRISFISPATIRHEYILKKWDPWLSSGRFSIYDRAYAAQVVADDLIGLARANHGAARFGRAFTSSKKFHCQMIERLLFPPSFSSCLKFRIMGNHDYLVHFCRYACIFRKI